MTKTVTEPNEYMLARVELTSVGDMMHPQMPTTIYVNVDHLKKYKSSEYVYYKVLIDDTAVQTLAKTQILKLIIVSTRESLDFGNAVRSLPARTQTEKDNDGDVFLNKELAAINKIANSAVGSPYVGLIEDDEDTVEFDVTKFDLGPVSKTVDLTPAPAPPPKLKVIRMVIGNNKKDKAEVVNAEEK